LLEDDGWWNTISRLASDHRSQIEQLAAVPDQQYKLYLDRQTPSNDLALEAFRQLLGTVEELVKRITAKPVDAVECFAAERGDIENCLAKGIVPSRLFSGRPLSSALPVAVVNAAFCFYLTDELPKLINRLADQDASNLQHRSHWTKRLEMWTIKAIEDFFLLDGAQRYGRGASRGTAVAVTTGSR
jgi:hypothetical protein